MEPGSLQLYPEAVGTLSPCPSCPPRRVQRGDGGVQEHLLHRLGRGRPGQNPTPLEALLPKHAGTRSQGRDELPSAAAGLARVARGLWPDPAWTGCASGGREGILVPGAVAPLGVLGALGGCEGVCPVGEERGRGVWWRSRRGVRGQRRPWGALALRGVHGRVRGGSGAALPLGWGVPAAHLGCPPLLRASCPLQCGFFHRVSSLWWTATTESECRSLLTSCRRW